MCKRRRGQSTISQCIVQVEVETSRSVCIRASPALRSCWDTWWRARSLEGRPELLLLLFDYYYLIIIITWEGGQNYYYYYLIIIITWEGGLPQHLSRHFLLAEVALEKAGQVDCCCCVPVSHLWECGGCFGIEVVPDSRFSLRDDYTLKRNVHFCLHSLCGGGRIGLVQIC